MKKKNNKGFSLIELIIAIAILVILTGLLAPQFMRYMEKARESKDMQALDTVYGAVQTALANEDAYEEIKATGEGKPGAAIAGLLTTGMPLSDLLGTGPDATAFVTEMKATIGATDSLWSSKAVTEAGGNTAVHVAINPKTLQVGVWIGDGAATDGVAPVVAKDLDTVLHPNGKDYKTQGVTFRIVK